MSSQTGRADHRGGSVEQDAEYVPVGGDGSGQREARLGGAVSRTFTDDGGAHS